MVGSRHVSDGCLILILSNHITFIISLAFLAKFFCFFFGTEFLSSFENNRTQEIVSGQLVIENIKNFGCLVFRTSAPKI